MNFIYDILLNFNSEFYEFYEWNLDDEICHIRKMPLFKLTTKQLTDMVNNEVNLEKLFLKEIYNKTEVFTKNEVKTISYACLLSDGDKVLAVKLNKNGTIISKSSLLIEEEDEVTDLALRMKLKPIDYSIIKKKNQFEFKTRKEIEIEKFIKTKINEETNLEKLRYLYFDCFGKKELDRDKIIKRIKNEINTNWDGIYLKIYNFFKLLSH